MTEKSNDAMWRAIDSFAKFVVVVVALWFSSTNFDKTEIYAIAAIAIGSGGVSGGAKLARKKITEMME
jgi:hypothetical protein